MNAGRVAKRRLGFWAICAIVFAIVVALLLAAAATLYIQRRAVVALIAQNYLRTRGVDSEVSFSTLGMGGFLARVRAGTVDQLDFTADSMEVTFIYPNDGMTPGIAAVRLVRPFLRVSYDGKTLSFGSLQKLIDEALAQPPEGEGPEVSIEEGELFLTTPYGTLQLTANLEIANRRVTHIDATLKGGTLEGQGVAAIFSGGTLKGDADGAAMNGSAAVKLDALSFAENTAHGVEAGIEISGLKWQEAEGSYRFDFKAGALTARSTDAVSPALAVAKSETRVTMQAGEGALADGRLTARTKGTVDVELADARFGARIAAVRFTEHMELTSAEVDFADGGLRVVASGTSSVAVANARAGAASLARLTAKTDLPTITANIARAGFSLEGNPRIALNGAGFRYGLKDGTVTVLQFRSQIAASGTLRDGNLQGDARVSLVARANIPRAVVTPFAQMSGDPALAASVAVALETVTLQISDADVRLGNEATVRSAMPIVLDGMGGARITLSPRGEAPLVKLMASDVTGALGLDIEGGGLPEIRLALSSYRYAGKAFEADTEFQTVADLAYLPGLSASGRGRLQSAGNRIAFALSGCADVRFAAFLNNKIAYLREMSAQLCAAPPQPLIVADSAGWRFEARLDDVAAKFETAGSALANGEGRIRISGQNASLKDGRVEIAQAELSDLVAPARFLAVSATGAMVLADGEWRGDVAVATGERRVAALALRHGMVTGEGSATIDARNLVFAPNQLQPADIAPALAIFGTRVNGAVNFTGNLAWGKDGIVSDGRLASGALGLGMQTAFGGVRGARFDLKLDSLLPVALAPVQTMTVQRVETFVPVENVTAQFTYTPLGFRLDSASAAVADGRIRLDPVVYDFTTGMSNRGILHLENLNVEPLIEAAGLTGRMTADAKIGGEVPFMLTPEGFRFDNGHVAATGPGRLSIKREALTGGVGVGDPNQVAPNAVQDFAYQALENMAFDVLRGDIDSRPMGRLGMVFRIQGRNDPVAGAETRIGVIELVRGEAFNKPLALPKGTPVDLTLDTSLNLDELLKSYFGGPQPAP